MRNVAGIVAVTAAGLLVAGCSSSSGSTPRPVPPTESGSSSTLSTPKTPLGTVVVDGQGYTLYRSDRDVPGESRCDTECARSWRPVISDAASGSELSGVKVGVTTRGDGSKQVTLDGWPLYRYSGDT